MTGLGSIQTDDSGAVRTYFAPPERAAPEQLNREVRIVAEEPLFQAIQEAIDGYLLVLNSHRQVLATNRRLLEDLGIPSADCLVGGRPGEIIECIHAPEGPGGCGTSNACSTCGAVISILTSQKEGRPSTGECLVTVKKGEHTESLEFRVRATPVRSGKNDFTVLVFNDISGDKRREALERIFFHDILNTIGGLMGWSSMLQNLEGLDPKTAAQKIVNLSERLTREVKDQRSLLAAERGELAISPEKTPVADIFETLGSIFSAHDAARGKTVEIKEVDAGEAVTTDSSLLVRVLTNMVKNALEAVGKGETVRVWFERREGDPTFLVWNSGVIPPEVALRIFQRSFSTKSKKGRGLGTYSMKLFGERYLGGKVDFESAEGKGTVFFIRLPAAGPPAEAG